MTDDEDDEDDDDDDDYEVIPLPAGYDDSEPGSIAELFARPVEHSGGLGDVLLSHPVVDGDVRGDAVIGASGDDDDGEDTEPDEDSNLVTINFADGSYIPTNAMADNARRALAIREKKPMSQRGMTSVGIARARDLMNKRPMSEDTVRRMKAFFDRHEADKQGEMWDEQGKGWQAWNGWGGDEGYSWATAIVERLNKQGDKKSFAVAPEQVQHHFALKTPKRNVMKEITVRTKTGTTYKKKAMGDDDEPAPKESAAERYFSALSEGTPLTGYVPKHEWGVANPGGGVSHARGSAWRYGPSESGVYCFRFLDARERERLTNSPSVIGQGRSELHVRIRRRSGTVTGTYVYLFDDAEAGAAVYEAMLNSPHPFTQVLVPDVIKKQVSYTLM